MFLSSLAIGLFSGTAFAVEPVNVLWYAGNQGSQVGINGFQTHLNGLGGQLDVRADTADWGSLDLGSYRYVVLSRPTEEFSAAQLADLQAYVQANGILVVVGGAGNAGSEPLYIHVLNTVLDEIGVDITLQNDNHAFLDADTGQFMCIHGTVDNNTPFVNELSPLYYESIGNMVTGVGAQSILQANFVGSHNTTETYTVLGRQGLVLVGADADLFGDDDCGLSAKQEMWRNIYGLYCDRDQDTLDAFECEGLDCDDNDDTVGASNEWADLDGDGFGDRNSPVCGVGPAVANSGDCDDTNPHVHRDAEEVCDQVDNDCNGFVDDDAVDASVYYPDTDGDGYGRDSNSEVACEQPDEMVPDNTDCDDGRDTVSPGATEVCGNNIDDNCSGAADEGCPTSGPTLMDPPAEEKPCGCSASTGVTGSLMLVSLGLLGLRRRS